MIQKLKKVVLLLTIIPGVASALVDYSESSVGVRQSSPVRANAPAPRMNRVKRNAPSSSSSKSFLPSGFFQFDTSYESLKVKTENDEGKVNFYHFHGNIQTGYDVYLDMTHWMAASSDDFLAETGDTQNGNSTLKLGFNWLEFGGSGDKITIDFLAGVTLGKNGSDFASSRTDKSFGLETAKQFQRFVLALGYELKLSGTPENEEEVKIGNIQHVSSALGWVVSNDIKLLLAGDYYIISSTESQDGRPVLQEDVSFGSVGPTVMLGISNLVEIQMGARFRTKRVDNEKLLGAKLYDLKGLYGSSIFAGLNFSI